MFNHKITAENHVARTEPSPQKQICHKNFESFNLCFSLHYTFLFKSNLS